jgi:hypothetical protein
MGKLQPMSPFYTQHRFSALRAIDAWAEGVRRISLSLVRDFNPFFTPQLSCFRQDNNIDVTYITQ